MKFDISDWSNDDVKEIYEALILSKIPVHPNTAKELHKRMGIPHPEQERMTEEEMMRAKELLDNAFITEAYKSALKEE